MKSHGQDTLSHYNFMRFEGDSNPRLLDEIGMLRLEVWREHGDKMVGDFTSGKWMDSEESKSAHWAAFCGDILIGASRLTVYKSLDELPDASFYKSLSGLNEVSVAYLTRDVVKREHEGKGIGSYFNQIRIDEAVKAGVDVVLASIPEYRLVSFLKLGFQMIRKPEFGYVFPETRWAVVVKHMK